MFEKLLTDICVPAHLYWVITWITIIYGVIVSFRMYLLNPLTSLVTLAWSVFWVYIITSGLKRICEDGYEGISYVLSVFMIIWWFNAGMKPPVCVN